MTTVLTDAFSYVGGHDFTTDTNVIQLEPQADTEDSTTYASGGWKEVETTLKSVSMNMEGFWAAGDNSVDSESFSQLGTQAAYTAGLVETAGQPAWMFEGAKFNYSLGGAAGALAPFSLSCYKKGSYGLVRGTLMKAKGDVSATGALGSGLQLGAVSSAQSVYATFHVFSAGTTITVVLESDDNSGFSSATTRATIGPLTTTGGTWVTPVAGAITDDYWRFRVTAITGTFSVAAAVAIA